MQIDYTAGNEHSPTDRSGRVAVRIGPDATADVELFAWTGERRDWTAVLDPSVLTRLADGLRAAHFPSTPAFRPMAGARMARIAVTGNADGADGAVLIPHREGSQTVGYADVLAVLDGLVAAVGGPSMGAAPLDPPPVRVEER